MFFLGAPQVHFRFKLSTINCINTNLRSEIRNDDELFENILRQDVRESRLFDIVGRHVNMISTQVKVGSGNGADTPLCLGRESGSLVITGGWHDNLIPVNVGCFGGRGGELWLILGLLLDLRDLLTLLGRSWNLHTQDDITDLRLRKWGHVHAVCDDRFKIKCHWWLFKKAILHNVVVHTQIKTKDVLIQKFTLHIIENYWVGKNLLLVLFTIIS